MANNIFVPILGKHIVVSIQPKSVNESGVTSDNGAAFSFVARLDEVQGGTTETETEPIVPMDCFQGNNMEIGEITRYSLSEILMALAGGRSGMTTGWRLAYLVSLGRYFSITITGYNNEATPDDIYVETAHCRWTRYDPNYRRGKCVGRLEFETHALFSDVGVYIANPTVSFPSPA